MMDLHKEEPVVGGMIQHIAHAMFKETNRDLLQYNLTGVQANVLVYLFFHEKGENIFQKDIEKHLNLTNPTVTGIVKRLEQKEMIHRHCRKEDARYKCHVLTDKGREFAKLAVDYMKNEKEKQILKGFSDDEADFLIRLLNRILKNLGE
ncbi:MarR family winged helix-turn-helix transcriptional regulator [Clostridium butyricum]|uniref:MarR family winged helix-turn-helix transcriptional regulator n=1 Tax=Clostridium butyricum TaxID=1492 RepID=UPI0013D72648|nr:MarR family transcriptional regulator [Clostridium butyricum]MCQ2017203.1 MarR family transcriptional regulator [Clostridium butyricum]MCQ2021082.1 MarR family transcriptional regulator [Clostridium butyricum]NFB72818.1 MarR family transcriptional regulator [Clostridium butyricum]NFB91059.1 MarR family transcriptional regulator [Clostridium butyricum]UTY53654.1 MarR family transcriptional regulator [Clostridium butyricum]